MPSNRYAVARAAAVLAENPGLTIGQLMRAARCSSGVAMRAIAEVGEPAVMLAKPVASRRATAGGAAIKREGNSSVGAAPQPVAKRAKALVREQLKHGPRPGAQIEAAAEAAAIPTPVLLAVTDELGVRTKRGEWWISGLWNGYPERPSREAEKQETQLA